MRCTATYPGAATLQGRAIRCELTRRHDGSHGHSFAARYWTDTDNPPTCPIVGRDWAGRLLACTLAFGHYRAHYGSHGGRLRRERGR